jgi:hypothetical protein
VSRSRERGQLVLVAALVVAVALVPLALAYLQLGYAADVGADADAPPDGSDAVRALDRALANATRTVAGRYDWIQRDRAVDRVTDRLDARTERVAAAGADRGVVYEFRRNGSAAERWAARNCPRGEDREFGDCRALDGVVVQERAGETAVLAAVYDVRVVADGGRTTLTVEVVAA